MYDPVVHPALLLVMLALTAARVTRLVVADAFPPAEGGRDWVRRRFGEDSWQDYLVNCPWCIGVWVAGALTAATTAWYGLPAPLLMWGSAAMVAGFLVAIESHDDED